MGALVMVPMDETGALVDPSTPALIKEALGDYVSDVFIFSHGWCANADRAMIDYSRFLLEFNRSLATLGAPAGLRLPADAVAIGLHWPSMYSEDPNAFANIFQVLSFHTMEVRTYAVGQGGGKQVIAAVWEWASQHANVPLRLHFVGHSFGCRVVCCSLVEAMKETALLQQFMNRDPVVPITLALLEAAMPNDVLARGHAYEILQDYGQPLRILTTRSDLDSALMNQNLYPAAEGAQPADQYDLSQPSQAPPPGAPAPQRLIPALGGPGPDSSTLAAYNNGNQTLRLVGVDVGFRYANVQWGTDRLLVADLTPLHLAHRREDETRAAGAPVPPGRPQHPTDPGGYHSDIYCDEVYRLLIGGLFS